MQLIGPAGFAAKAKSLVMGSPVLRSSQTPAQNSMPELIPSPVPSETLVAELSQLISETRRHATVAVNAALTVLYWRIGDRIRRSVLRSERAVYGDRILATLSHELTGKFGRDSETTNLSRMVKFAEAFPIELVAFPGATAARAARAA
jgi:hypothetical protein